MLGNNCQTFLAEKSRPNPLPKNCLQIWLSESITKTRLRKRRFLKLLCRKSSSPWNFRGPKERRIQGKHQFAFHSLLPLNLQEELFLKFKAITLIIWLFHLYEHCVWPELSMPPYPSTPELKPWNYWTGIVHGSFPVSRCPVSKVSADSPTSCSDQER